VPCRDIEVGFNTSLFAFLFDAVMDFQNGTFKCWAFLKLPYALTLLPHAFECPAALKLVLCRGSEVDSRFGLAEVGC
jgi:hypothetical protein